MHRTPPYLDSLTLDRPTREAVASNLPLDTEAALAPVFPEKLRGPHPYNNNNNNNNLSRSLGGDSFRRYQNFRHRSLRGSLGGSLGHSFRNEITSAGNVIEPVRMLHHCIRYFASHPELYGSNLRALLDRELMYVMRVKASETALLTPGTVPVTPAPLPPIITSRGNNNNNNNNNNKLQHPALSKCAGWMVSPRSIDAALSTATVIGGEGMFGYGGTAFVEATPGFISLLDKANRRIDLHDRASSSEGYNETEDPTLFLDNIINNNNNNNNNNTGLTPQEKSVVSEEDIQVQDNARVRFLSNENIQGLHHSNLVDNSPKVIIDGASYEVSFLRSQLQQVEAAYNAKCIYLHELQQENNRNKTDLQNAEKKIQQQTVKINEMKLQIETMMRELDAWKQRASELNLNNHSSTSQDSGEVSRRLQAMQVGEAKRELAHLSRLWRETEKSLQETKRNLESSEKESHLSHRYLEDAFNLIERLERRIDRRNRYIKTQFRRQMSLEEKYEKLMWCLKELETLKGGHSYIDYLLSENSLWSMFLFVRLQRHIMGFAQLEEPIKNNLIPIYFRRTPSGGKFYDSYSPKLIYNLIISHISGKIQNSRFLTSLGLNNNNNNNNNNFMLRWRGLYSIDYLFNTDTNNNNNNNIEGNTNTISTSNNGGRRNFPILTLPSILLPQQSSPIIGDVSIEDEIPNINQYDQASIRLILYCFWGERLSQYKQEMERRIQIYNNKLTKKNSTEKINEGIELEANSSENEEKSPSFLTALVQFVQRLFPLGGINSSTQFEGSQGYNTTITNKNIIIRGIVAKNEKLWENKRMFFSSIINIEEDGTETPVNLSSQARELLYALYYFSEEYKEVDSDHKLFYLIAHQQIPEIVAINFYASLEVLRKSCDEILCQNLAPKQFNESNESSISNGSTLPFTNLNQDINFNDTPFNALTKAVEIIDSVPLVEENVCIEPDSDGEGYGLILPGKNISSNSTAENKESENKNKGKEEQEEEEQGKGLIIDSEKLKHNIREYLFPLDECNNKEKEKEDNKIISNDVNDYSAKKLPSSWISLQERLGEILGPHTQLLDAFQKSKENKMLKNQSYKRRKFTKESSSYSAARGLLSISEIMTLIYKHCFATYAVSCCGGSRFSLIETLLHPNNEVTPNISENILNLDPLTSIGYFPPTETQIRRMRFAIAMDQPASLIRYSDLFGVDSRYGSTSHFYDEYLQLTLERYLEQQELWMNVILTSFTAQQIPESNQNILDETDGNITFPNLRLGIGEQFRQLLLGSEQSNIFAKHFLQYCELLRHEDDIRLEQFVDAPFFINTPPLEQKEADKDFANIQERRWALEDEAASCSLLHLSLAVRMTYIVWGFDSSPSARLAGNLFSLSSKRFVDNSEFSIGHDEAENKAGDVLFLENMKKEYEDAIGRIRTGVAQYNELRDVLNELNGTSNLLEQESEGLRLPSFTGRNSNLGIITNININTENVETSLDIRRLYAPWDLEQQLQLQQKQFEGTTKSGRRSKLQKQKNLVDLSNKILLSDVKNLNVYMPTTVSLSKFLGIGRLNKPKVDKKKKKTEMTKGVIDINNILLTPCAVNDNIFMSHQIQLAKRIMEIALTPEIIPKKISKSDIQNNEEISNMEGEVRRTSTSIYSSHKSHSAGVSTNLANINKNNSIDEHLKSLPEVLGNDDYQNNTMNKNSLYDKEIVEVDEGKKSKKNSINFSDILKENAMVRKLHASCATLSLM